MAAIIAFPVVPRPMPLEQHPIYRRGVADFCAAVLCERHGYSLEFAKSEAARLTALTLDDLPADFGAGEV